MSTDTLPIENPTDLKKTKTSDMVLRYIPLGEQEELPLSFALVRKYVCKPSKSGVWPDARDIVGFMFLCRARRLNPFTGDVYLIGYDRKDGSGADFVMQVGVDHFMKRAELHEAYDGFESGVIVVRSKGADGKKLSKPEIEERPGEFYLPDERMLGAWCKVYRTDRSRPVYRTINLSPYNKNNTMWKSNPAGMLVKCAEVAGHRKGFPLMLGGLFSPDETDADAVDLGELAEVQAEMEEMVKNQLPENLTRQTPDVDISELKSAETPELEPAGVSRPPKPESGAESVSEPPAGEGLFWTEGEEEGPMLAEPVLEPSDIEAIQKAKDTEAVQQIFQMLFQAYPNSAIRQQITDMCRERQRELDAKKGSGNAGEDS